MKWPRPPVEVVRGEGTGPRREARLEPPPGRRGRGRAQPSPGERFTQGGRSPPPSVLPAVLELPQRVLEAFLLLAVGGPVAMAEGILRLLPRLPRPLCEPCQEPIDPR